MQPLIDPRQATCRTEGASPSRQDGLLRPHLPKTKTGRDKFVPFEKFGGAIQIAIPPWPDSRALVGEAGRVGRDYMLRVAGAEPLAPRSNCSTSIHDR